MREAVRAAIELAVGQRLVPEDHGDRVGAQRRFGREERRDAGLARVVGGRLVPGDHDALPLLVAADRERADRRRGGRDDALEEDAEVLEQALHRGAVEEIGVEDDRGDEALRALGHRQREIELGRRALGARRPHLEAAERGLRLGRGVLEDEHHLEERRAAPVALGRDLLHQALEGEILVGVGAEAGLLHAREQLREGELARELGAEREGVDEDADERLGLGLGAVGDRRADDDVVLARVAVEEHVERREEDHEERGALAACEILELTEQRQREPRDAAIAARRLHRRPRAIGREIERGRRAREARPPVRELPVERLALEPRALPRGVVAVLEGERRER